MLVRGATVRDHVWKAIKRIVKLLMKEDGDKQLGIELGTNFFIIHVCSNTAIEIFIAALEQSPLVSVEGKISNLSI